MAGVVIEPVDDVSSAATPESSARTQNERMDPKDLNISDNGINLIKDYETWVAKPDPDPLGNPTVGYGHKLTPDEMKNGTFSAGLSKTEAIDLMRKDLGDSEAAVRDSVDVPLSQNEFDALVSYAYNSYKGMGNLRKKSTAVEYLNKGDYQSAADALRLTRRGKDRKTGQSKVLDGLKARRNDERQMFLNGDYKRDYDYSTIEDYPDNPVYKPWL